MPTRTPQADCEAVGENHQERYEAYTREASDYYQNPKRKQYRQAERARLAWLESFRAWKECEALEALTPSLEGEAKPKP